MAIKVSVTVCLIPEAKGGPFILWDDLPAAARLASELGFDAVELFPPEPDTLNPDEVKALLAKHKLAVSAVGSGAGHHAHSSSHVADHGLQHLYAFAIVHARHFAGDAERGEAVDARADEEIDHALETLQI